MGAVQLVGVLLLCALHSAIQQEGSNSKPQFIVASYNFLVEEESVTGTVIGQVNATGQNGQQLTYFLPFHANARFFHINGTSGVITLAQNLDREALSQVLNFQVSVRDTSSRVGNVDVRVIITDINDNAPLLLNLNVSITLDENTEIGSNVFVVQATDRDQGLNANIIYDLMESDLIEGGPFFEIDPELGRIDLAKSLNYDVPRGKEHTLTILASDRASDGSSQTSIDFLYIQVRDVNDQDPIFLQNPYQRDVFENLTVGEDIIRVTARDQDEGVNDSILYHIRFGNSLINGVPSFSINETTGWITIRVEQLDREIHSSYNLTVQGSESMSASNHAFTTVIITVFDVNDHFPEFEEPFYEAIIDENTDTNSLVLTVLAVDRDEGQHAEFDFSLVNVNPISALDVLPFHVLATSVIGEAAIFLTDELDYEDVDDRFFYFNVIATEVVGGGLRNGTTVVEVSVRNLNDNTPIFDEDLYTAVITENTPISTSIIMVSAHDGDAGSFGNLFFSIVAGDDDGKFSITSLSGNTALIRTAQRLDYERLQKHMLTIRVEDLAEDRNNRRSNYTTLEVAVDNVNDNQPSFVDSDGVALEFASAIVEEEQLEPVTVLHLQVVDEDGTLNDLNFYFSSGNGLNYFEIDHDRLLINTTRKLDFDLDLRNYTLLVVVNDSLFYDYLSVSVQVLDINDNYPQFSKENYTFSVEENMATGSSVGSVFADDLDSSVFGQVEYSLAGQHEDLKYFWLNASTGELFIREPINREMTAGPIAFSVIASDLDSNLAQRNTDTAMVSVYVLDLNDNAPYFTETSYSFSVAENTDQLMNVGVSAKDPDLGFNSDLIYAITGGNENNAFVLDPDTGSISRNATYNIDFEEVRRYRLNISVEDQGNPSNMATQEVIITITDENDNTPTFSVQNITISIREDTSAGTSVIQLVAEDRDSDEFGRRTYSITSVRGPSSFLQVNGTFVIPDNSIGTIYTAGNFDREAFEGPYSVMVDVRDNGVPPNNGSTILSVIIADANDNAPTFESSVTHPSPAEEQAPGILIATLTAMDLDEKNSNNSRLEYAITAVLPTLAPQATLDPSDNVLLHFALGNSSSQVDIVTNAVLDYEKIVAYKIMVTASDNGDPSLSSDKNVQVTVLDSNDNSPVFIFPFNFSRYEATLHENSPFSRPIQFLASDADSGTNAQLQFTFTNLSNVPSNIFSIDGNVLNVADNSLNYEVQQSYLFNVTVMDRGTPYTHSTTAQVQITVLDENDNSPIFEKTSYTSEVYEGDYSNTSVLLEVNATDEDSEVLGNITFEVFPADSLFSVTTLLSGGGQLIVEGELDRETDDTYTITILARDGGKPPNTGTTTVTVHVLDVNDNTPILTEVLYTAALHENVGPVPILDISDIASDLDFGRNRELIYSLLGTSDFVINQESMKVMNIRSFDFEQEQVLVVNITVRDNATDDMILSDSAILRVHIIDVNDNTPYFINFPSDVLFVFPEDSPPGTTVASIMANDNDSTSNGDLSNDEGRFAINSVGVITVLSSLDRETTDIYNLTVTVTDQGEPALFFTDYLHIKVDDVNDGAPQLEINSYNFLIAEDVSQNTSLGQLLAFDVDEGENGVIEFDIVMGDTTRFQITTSLVPPIDDRQTYAGNIFTNESLNYEEETLYILQVRARNIVPPYMEEYADVVITVRDINDNAPVFSMPAGYIFSVPEVTATLGPVGIVVATDMDGGLNGTVFYQLSAGTEPLIFETFNLINESGVIILKSALNFEILNLYEFTVEAYDGSSVPLASNVSITVIVQDTNEEAPMFDMISYSSSLRENVLAGAVVVQVNATERESGGSTVRYSLVAGTSHFEIDAITGIITSSIPLDREDRRSYVLTVQARDSAAMPLSSFAQVFVEVQDVNDNSPTFGINATTVRLPESSQVGTTLPETYMATDIDTGINAVINYFLFPNNVFTVHLTTGVVSVISPDSLDREVQPSWTLHLVATDLGLPQLASELIITVQLEDINDNAPVFSQQVYTATVSEGVANGILVTEVEASDADLISNFVYSIESGDDNDRKFRINPSTGLISTTSSTLDREVKDFYILAVAVSDGVIPARTETATVEVTVMDVNDNTPACTQRLFKFTVQEANDEEVLLGRVSATDADSRSDLSPAGSGRLIYLLENSNLLSILRVDLSNGDVFGRAEMLDYESGPIFQFTVRVTDQPDASAGPSRHSICNGLITLIDINDNAPVFEENPYQALISESAAIGTLIITLHAVDNDQGTNGVVFYRFRGQSSMFSIDSESGKVTLSVVLDSDVSNRHVVDVEAVDQGFPEPRNGQTGLIIRVIDVDDTRPNFQQSFYDVSISEGIPLDSTVIEVAAVDADSTLLTYSIIGGDEDRFFRILRTSGAILVSRSLDREDIAVYSLLIIAEDSAGNNGSTTVRISLTDINDKAPEFQQTEYMAFVKENSAVGTPVLPVSGNATITIQAIDEDQPNTPNSRVMYQLEGANAVRFNIDPASGIVTVARGANLNYEDIDDRAGLALTVVASDSNAIDPRSSSVSLTVIIEDVNDMAPAFSRLSGYAISISENLQVNTLITSEVSATDEDTVGGDVRYALTNALPFSALAQFSIDRETGHITLMMPLDRETNPSITLVVTASDMGEPALSSVVTVLITVSDVNDNFPKFGQDIFTTTVPEFLGIGASAFTVSAVDSDAAGLNSEVSYMLRPAMPSFFIINPVTGDITTTQILDYETISSHSLEAIACDHGNSSMCGRAIILINIRDFNDEMPMFDQETYITDVCYGSANLGQALVQPVATDRDSGLNAALTYSLVSQPPTFTVSPNTGRVSISASIEADIGTHTFTILATDAGASRLTGTAEVIIQVLNCSNTAFYFTSPFQYIMIEEGTNVFIDNSVNQKIILSQTPSIVFFSPNLVVNPLTNILNNVYIKASQDLLPELRQGDGLDREARSLYTVILAAQDGRQRTTFTSITLEVQDSNDNRPEFVSDLFIFTVIENTTAPVLVGSVEARDRDEGDNARVRYTILSVVPPSMMPSFTINATTGAISTAELLDREANTQIDIEVLVSDEVFSDTSSVKVTVEDINDCDPTFLHMSYSFRFLENLPAGTSVGAVMAMDCDEGTNADIRYSITGGSVSVFQLDLLSGVITTLNPFDFEQTSEYSLIITATDMGSPNPRHSDIFVTFQVEDFNDCPPVFVNHPTSITLTENNNINSVIQRFAVQDCDSDLNGVNGTRFSIISGNELGRIFEIDEFSGILTIVATLNRERQDTYIVRVRARDSAMINPLFSITEITVTVLDVNDNAPVFLVSGEVSLMVSEGVNTGQTLFTVQAMDADIGSNGEVTYSLLGGNGDFSIDAESGQLAVAQLLDRENEDNYKLTVVGRDLSTEPRSSNITILVTVQDENDNDPIITNIISRVTTVEIAEGLHDGSEVFIINATDLDDGANGFLVFYLDDSSDDHAFNITGNVVNAYGLLDYETQITYFLTVVAEDSGSRNSRRAIATLVVEVTDNNDNSPIFVQDTFSSQQLEGVDVASSILRVRATDSDQVDTPNSIVQYSLGNTENSQYFFINNNSGIIYNNITLDRESKDFYMFTVIATNYLSSSPLSGIANVIIRVADVNDEVPQFGQSLYAATLTEGTPPDTTVLTVTALDGDLANTPNSELTFSLTRQSNNPFFIHPNTGELIVQNQLDYETSTSYDFEVVVEDKGSQPQRDSARIMVNLTDVNDQRPIFEQSLLSILASEGSSLPDQPRRLAFFRFSDDDTLPENTNSTISVLSVSTVGSQLTVPSDLFTTATLTNDSGLLYLHSPFDFETAQGYNLMIQVRNNENGTGDLCQSQPTCTLSSVAIVNVNVIDINDNSPVFAPLEYSGEISTTSLPGASILTVSATDADITPDFNAIQYTLESNPQGRFRIGATTGTLFTLGSFSDLDGSTFSLRVVARDNHGQSPNNDARCKVKLVVLNNFKRIAITFNTNVEVIEKKEGDIVSLLRNLTGYEIVIENYRDFSTDPKSSTFIFHAIDEGKIVDFSQFIERLGNNRQQLFDKLATCNITAITSIAVLEEYIYPTLLDTETIVILILCLILILGSIILLVISIRQRYLALHAARHKLLADVFYGSHAGSMVDNIQQENVELDFIESKRPSNKQNPMFVHPYENWAGVDSSGVESIGEDSNLQRDNPLYESQEIRMEMFADISDEEDRGEDERDEAELLAAALQEDSEAEENSVTDI